MLNFKNVYINSTGRFLPNEPVKVEDVADYIKPINKMSSRLQKRVLGDNGIHTRFYAINKEGRTTHSLAEMCRLSVLEALGKLGHELSDYQLLCAGTTGGDTVAPGFANMLQGHLKAPPMETSSHSGICMAGVVALKHAAYAIESKDVSRAIVSTGEFPSRMFKQSRFQEIDYNVDFDSHFLRWMLSDGAGTWLVDKKPKASGLSLKLDFIHTNSFSGDFPVCMYLGAAKDAEEKSYLDYGSLREAEANGAFYLRQNLKILPNIFEIGVHEYFKLVQQDVIKPEEITHFLCHYSSEKFKPVIKDLVSKSKAYIADEKWFSNLPYHGNMGAASIFVMLDDFLEKKSKDLKPGDKLLFMVPESGRFSISYLQMEVVQGDDSAVNTRESMEVELPSAPSDGMKSDSQKTSKVLRELTQVWHDYRSEAWRSPLVRSIREQKLTAEHYLDWTENWIPQVREGSKWMRTAIGNMRSPFDGLKLIIEEHATEEQDDWKILHKDHLNAGGTKTDPDALKRNYGGEALNSFMFYRASQESPIDLLGGIYIIEGTGQRIIPMLLPLIRKSTGLGPECFKFLHYHGLNDENHLLRWLSALELVAAQASPEQLERVIETARITSELYLLQLKAIHV